MIVLNFLAVAFDTIVCLYFFAEVLCSIRERKLQKQWNKEKAMRLRIDPAITRAELCERYVMFCKRNDCKVDF